MNLSPVAYCLKVYSTLVLFLLSHSIQARISTWPFIAELQISRLYLLRTESPGVREA